MRATVLLILQDLGKQNVKQFAEFLLKLAFCYERVRLENFGSIGTI